MTEELDAGASVHEQIAAKLKARRKADVVEVDKLEPIDHEVFGETFYVGAMDYVSHKQWIELRRFEDVSHIEQNRTEEDSKDRSKSDQILLANAVYTEDGKNCGMEIASGLLELKGAGPDNFKLLSVAEKANPPREFLAIEVSQMMNKSTIDCILWRLLMECGLGKVLIDYMSTHSSPEEKAWAEQEMAKVAEVVYAFQPLFEAEDTAKTLGINFRQGINLIAMYGDSDTAIKEYTDIVEGSGE